MHRTTLGALMTFKGGSAFPQDEQGGTVRELPFAKVSDLGRTQGDRYLDPVKEWISDAQAKRMHPAVARPGAVLFAKIGEGLRAERFRQIQRPTAFDNNVMSASANVEVCEPEFLFYLLQTINISQHANGSALPYLTQARLEEVEVEVPPLPEQQAIAEVLGALDDKIAANRALVATSLELVTLHHRQIKASAPMLTMRYTEAAEVGGGATPSTKEPSYWGGSIPWAAPTDITALSAPYLEDTPRKITNAGLAACSSPLYPAGSILMTSRATIGAFAVTQIPTAVNQGFIVVKPQDPALRWWLLAEMQHRVPEYINRANGATFLELPRKAFRDMEFTRPNDAALHRFDQLADPLHQSAIAAQRESAILANLRDTLLPALMDGTIRVKDAIATAEEVL